MPRRDVIPQPIPGRCHGGGCQDGARAECQLEAGRRAGICSRVDRSARQWWVSVWSEHDLPVLLPACLPVCGSLR